jgi:hypothetical protein
MQISRLERVSLRELWRHEARDFTTWLAGNLDQLGEVLGFPLTLLQTEVATGTFSADILADAGSERLVVIENQLESTDHDHLGKLITYLSNLNASIAIWITSQPRPEHEQAIHWLNEWLPKNIAFYLVRVEAIRIVGGAHAAPLFTIVAGPSKAAREAGKAKKDLAERHVLRKEFWTQLLERARRSRTCMLALRPALRIGSVPAQAAAGLAITISFCSITPVSNCISTRRMPRKINASSIPCIARRQPSSRYSARPLTGSGLMTARPAASAACLLTVDFLTVRVGRRFRIR